MEYRSEVANRIQMAVNAMRNNLGAEFPETAIILGSGLNALAEEMKSPVYLDYRHLPGFPVPAVRGHKGRMVVGTLGGVRVAVLQGRLHYYEGEGFGPLRIMIWALGQAGAKRLLLTNAAGSLNTDMKPGTLVLVRDHINMSGANPLIGGRDPEEEPRFTDMTQAYDPALRKALKAAAKAGKLDLPEGVYCMTSGPNFETPAEIAAYRTLGADLVGMSTVPECLLARHAGLDVGAVSIVTNYAAGMGDGALSHQQTVSVAEKAAQKLTRLIKAYLKAA